ncbi:MAG: metal ABC transporter permease [Candidatus Yanofskybacteria bacterium]|nr:metal ABC transporter permease [Candidatus Yanofskybacteria bacterium]
MLELFQFDFMVRALGAGLMVAFLAPVIGMFLVVRRYSLMADTLAHVALAGIAMGIILQVYTIAAAVALSVGAAVLIEILRVRWKIFGESLLAIFLSGSLAIAAVLLSVTKGFQIGLFGLLFGSIATVSQTDVYVILGFGTLVLGTIFLLYKEFLFVSLDQEFAQVSGRKARILNIVLMALTAMAVALSIRIVGVLLVGALTVIPVIAAMQLGRSFLQTMGLAVLFSLLSVISGIFLSYSYDLATGGTIVVVALAIFILSLLVKGKR